MRDDSHRAGVLVVGFEHRGPVGKPFPNDQQYHVTEQSDKEDKLWDELANEIDGGFEVNCVGAFEHDSEAHMEDTQNNSEFHFERVEEADFIATRAPSKVQAEWVNAVTEVRGTVFPSFGKAPLFVALGVSLNFVTRAGDGYSYSKELVVDEPAVHSEETH